MTEPTLSTRIRAIQNQLNAITNELADVLHHAQHIGLAPFRLANIDAATIDTEHAWEELNRVATSLELTGAAHQP